jgi:hypothetical protein
MVAPFVLAAVVVILVLALLGWLGVLLVVRVGEVLLQGGQVQRAFAAWLTAA